MIEIYTKHKISKQKHFYPKDILSILCADYFKKLLYIFYSTNSSMSKYLYSLSKSKIENRFSNGEF